MRLRDGHRFPRSAPLIAMVLAATTAHAAGEDHSMVQRFPESKVIKRSVRNLEAYWIPLGRLSGDGQAGKSQVVEGKWTHVTYSNPAKSSVIAIGRRYDQQLRDAGFEIGYDCRDGECGPGGRKTNGDWWDPNYQRRYLVARLKRDQGDVWACVHVHAKGPNVPGQHDVDVIEAKPEPREMPMTRDESNPDWIEKELQDHGRVALYGIGFDAKRGGVLPTSDATLKAVAEFLGRDANRRLLVVVHTGDRVHWKTGVQASRRQATALLTTLVRKHGVPAARVAGDGVGPLAPAAPGPGTPKDAGAARVELVAVEPVGSTLRATGNPD